MTAGALSADLISDIAGGVAARLRSLAVALDRLDRLESGTGTWLSGFDAVELPDAATELTLRALRTGADPINFAILKTLAVEDSQPLAHLIEKVGLRRLTLSERLNDLVQVGLATRLIDTDHAQITPAGAGAVRLVEGLIAEVVEQYSAHKQWK